MGCGILYCHSSKGLSKGPVLPVKGCLSLLLTGVRSSGATVTSILACNGPPHDLTGSNLRTLHQHMAFYATSTEYQYGVCSASLRLKDIHTGHLSVLVICG